VRDADYWFPAKRYGWGWGPPRRWQGWAVLLIGFLLLALAMLLLLPHHPIAFLICVLVMTLLLLWICYAKGEPPGWRWG
jgi:hypothetical protein